MAKEHISGMRKDYGIRTLEIDEVNTDPFVQFEEWFDEAMKSDGQEANVCTLSTLDENQVPEGRIVLLKNFDEQGFTFFTNYESDKARQIEHHPFGSMTFHWRSQERQVRLKGTIQKVSSEVSDGYFKARPKGSRIGAWASPQSKEIPDRAFLDRRVADYESKFDEREDIPRPTHWGGYLIIPQAIEFWQGRPSRLHDRIAFTFENGRWISKRLAP